MSLPTLSPAAEEYYKGLDPDDQYQQWQVPIIHKREFQELIDKGYLIPGTRTGTALQGNEEKETKLPGYQFAAEVKAARERELYGGNA